MNAEKSGNDPIITDRRTATRFTLELALEYDQRQMRRSLAITLLFLIGLAPLAALWPASSDAHLPACCRRNGAHHCAMSMGGSGSGPGHHFAAPSHCPLYKAHGPAATTHFLAVAATPLHFARQPHLHFDLPASVHCPLLRSRDSRGPPPAFAS